MQISQLKMTPSTNQVLAVSTPFLEMYRCYRLSLPVVAPQHPLNHLSACPCSQVTGQILLDIFR